MPNGNMHVKQVHHFRLQVKDLLYDVNLDAEARGITRVGSYPSYAWGLNDMIGIGYEWRSDRINRLPSEPQIDPQGPIDEEMKVKRGGSFNTLIIQICLYDKGWTAP